MTPFAVGVAAVVAGGLAAATLWCATGVFRRGGSRRARVGWWLALALALVAIPEAPGPAVPVRVERALYEGPDLLSGEPEVTRVLAEDWIVPGLVRVRTVRTSQANQILREAQRVEVALPVALLLVLGAWGAAGTRRSSTAATLLIGAMWTTGCVPGDSMEASLAEVRLMEFMAMRQSGDVTGAETLFSPVAVWDDYPNQVQYRGLPEIAERIVGLHGWATGVFLDVVRTHVSSDRAVAEWVLQGVQGAPYPGVADSATFRRFTVEGVTVVELEQGRIVRVADYADMIPLVLDLGGSVTLPSGEVVARPDSAG